MTGSKQKRWSESELNSLKLDFISLSKTNLCNKYKIEYEQIRYAGNKILKLKRPKNLHERISRKGLTNKNKGKMIFRYDLDLIKKFVALKKTNLEISKELNCCPQTIHKIIQVNNIFVKNKASTGHRRYNLNESVFNQIDTEEKAYWLGFLYADGCIKHDKCYLIQLDLCSNDAGQVEKFKKFCESESPIKQNKKRNSTKIRMYSKEMFESLDRLGCNPKKTFTLRYPTTEQLPLSLTNHFIRGYLDGDGSIFKYGKSGFGVSFCGTLEFLTKLQQELVKNCKVNFTKIQHPSNIYHLAYQGRLNVIKICEFLYKNSTIFLERKKNKFTEIKNISYN